MSVEDALSILTGGAGAPVVSEGSGLGTDLVSGTDGADKTDLSRKPAVPKVGVVGSGVSIALSILSGPAPVDKKVSPKDPFQESNYLEFEGGTNVTPMSKKEFESEQANREATKGSFLPTITAIGRAQEDYGKTLQRTPEQDEGYQQRYSAGEVIAKNLGIDEKKVRYQGTNPIITPDMKKGLSGPDTEKLFTYLSEKKRSSQVQTGKKIEAAGKQNLKYMELFSPYVEANLQDDIVKIQTEKPSIMNSLRTGNVQGAADEFVFDAMMSGNDIAIQKAITVRNQLGQVAGEKQQQVKDEKALGKELILSTAQMLPMMAKGAYYGAIPVIGPALSTSMWARQGAGEILADMEKAGVPRDVALPVALNAGLAYSLIESMQVGQIKNIDPIKKAINAPIKKKILYLVKAKGIDWVKENIEEINQSLIQVAAVDVAKKKTGIELDSEGLVKKYRDTVVETFKQSAGPMGLLSALGLGAGAVKIGLQGKEQTAGKPVVVQQMQSVKSGDAVPVKNKALEILTGGMSGENGNSVTDWADGTNMGKKVAPSATVVAEKTITDFDVTDDEFWQIKDEEKRNQIFSQLSEAEQDRLQNVGGEDKGIDIEEIRKRVSDVDRDDDIEKGEIENVDLAPTDGQKDAGNYRKGHIRKEGFDISIENPAQSVRTGTNSDGKKWETVVRHDYGYIRGTKGADGYRNPESGDQVDVFINPGATTENKPVFVIDQVDPKTGKFDEHKTMMGFDSAEEAKKAYLSNYEAGWKGFGAITEMTLPDFKEWVYSEATKDPAKNFVKPQKHLLSETNSNEGSVIQDETNQKAVLKDGNNKNIEDMQGKGDNNVRGGQNVSSPAVVEQSKDLVVKAFDGSSTLFSYNDLDLEDYNLTKKIYDDYARALPGRIDALNRMPVSKERTKEKWNIEATKRAVRKWEEQIRPWMEKGLREKGIKVVENTTETQYISKTPSPTEGAQNGTDRPSIKPGSTTDTRTRIPDSQRSGTERRGGSGDASGRGKGVSTTQSTAAVTSPGKKLSDFNLTVDKFWKHNKATRNSIYKQLTENERLTVNANEPMKKAAGPATYAKVKAKLPKGSYDAQYKYQFTIHGLYVDFVNAMRFGYKTSGGTTVKGSQLGWLQDVAIVTGRRSIFKNLPKKPSENALRYLQSVVDAYSTEEAQTDFNEKTGADAPVHTDDVIALIQEAKTKGEFVIYHKKYESEKGNGADGSDATDNEYAAAEAVFNKNPEKLSDRQRDILEAEWGMSIEDAVAAREQGEEEDSPVFARSRDINQMKMDLFDGGNAEQQQEMDLFQQIVPKQQEKEPSLFSNETGDLFAGTQFGDKRTNTQKEIDRLQREKKEKADRNYKGTTGLPLFDKNEQEAMATDQLDLFGNPSFARSAKTEKTGNPQIYTPEFKKWFGDWENDPENASKVVDYSGRPLVVYHGSPDARFLKNEAIFKSDYKRYGMGKKRGAHWFASSSATARTYADDHRAFDYQNAEPAVVSTYLNMRNPLEIFAGGKEWREAQRIGKTSNVIEKAQAEGHDGVIIRGVKDDYNNSRHTKTTDTFVVFDSNQIKSATENNGAFDAENPDIRFARGRTPMPPKYDIVDGIHKVGMHEASQALHKNLQEYDAWAEEQPLPAVFTHGPNEYFKKTKYMLITPSISEKDRLYRITYFEENDNGQMEPLGHYATKTKAEAFREVRSSEYDYTGKIFFSKNKELLKGAQSNEVPKTRTSTDGQGRTGSGPEGNLDLPRATDKRSQRIEKVLSAAFHRFARIEFNEENPQIRVLAPLTDIAKKTTEVLRRLTGKEVVWFESDAEIEAAMGFSADGVSFPRAIAPELSNQIFINVNSSRPALWVAAHELWHFLEQNQAYHDMFWNAVKLTAKGRSMLHSMAKDLKGAARSEFAADIVGEMITDPEFWEVLEKQDKNVFDKIIRKVIEVLSRLSNRLKEVFAGTTTTKEYTSLIENVDDVRQTLARILVNYHKSKNGGESVDAPSNVAAAMMQLAGPKAEVKPVDMFYSPLLKAVRGLKQEKGTGEQFFNMLTKAPGVKEAEWKWMGLDDFLKGKTSVTRGEIEEFVRGNEVRVEEAYKFDNVDTTFYPPLTQEEENRWQLLRNNFADWDYEKGEYSGERPLTPEEETEKKSYEQRHNNALDNRKKRKGDKTKYENFVIPGAENYREILMTLPKEQQKYVPVTELPNDFEYIRNGSYWGIIPVDRTFGQPYAGWHETQEDALKYGLSQINFNRKNKFEVDAEERAYKSSHWDEPNVFAHTRLDDRTGPDGEKVLFVEEIQSDWEREAREKGVMPETKEPVTLPEGYTIQLVGFSTYSVYDKEGRTIVSEVPAANYADAKEKAIKRLTAEKYRIYDSAVPNQPFLKNWQEVVLKRILRMAAEEGYDRVSWINGKQTADRYDLSKQVEYVLYSPDGLLTVVGKNDNELLNKKVNENEIADYIGKEPARRLLESPKSPLGIRRISGENLRMGGEWAFNLYDKMIPQFMNKYGKKWGAQVENVAIDGIGEQQSIAVTPAMKDAVLYEGQPLFAGKRVQAEQIYSQEFKKWFGDWENDPEYASKVVDESGKPMVVYHGTEKAGFAVFEEQGIKKTSGAGFFFSDTNRGASTYSGTTDEANINEEEASPGNYPAYLKMINPFIIDVKGEAWDNIIFNDWWDLENKDGDLVDTVYSEAEANTLSSKNGWKVSYQQERLSTDEIAREAKGMGCDGVIFKNVSDEGGYGQGYNWGNNVYTVFNSNQIKSATQNSGAFSYDNPDIRFARSKSPLKSKEDMAKAKADLTAEKERVAELEREMNQMKGRLLSLPEDRLLERAEINLKIKSEKLEELDQIKNLILQYAKNIGIDGVGYNKVAAQVSVAKTVRGLEKAVRVMDQVWEGARRVEAIEALEKVLEREYRRLNKVASGKLKSTVAPEYNIALKKYLDELTSSPDTQPAADGVEPFDYKGWVDKMLAYYNMYAQKDIKQSESLKDLPVEIMEWMEDPSKPVPDKISKAIKYLFKHTISTMNTDEILKVLDDIESLKATGRTVKMAEDFARELELNNRAEAGAQVIKDATRDPSSSEETFLQAAKNNKLDKFGWLGKLAEKGLWSLIDAERMVEWLSGFKNIDVLKNSILKPLYAAEKTKMDNLKAAQAAFEKLHKDVDMAELYKDKLIEIDFKEVYGEVLQNYEGKESKITLTSNQGMFVYANSQNPGNRAHLIGMFGGEGIAENVIKRVVDALPEKLKRIVDTQIDWYDNVQYYRMNPVFLNEHEVPLPKEQRYFPIQSVKTDRAESAIVADYLARHSSKLAGVQKGMTKMRVHSQAPFKQMDYVGTVVRNVLSTEHYIAYNDAIRDVSRFLNHKEVRAAIEDKNEEVYSQIKEWLKAVAYGRVGGSENILDKITDYMRGNFSTFALGLRLTTSLQQFASLPRGMGYLDKKSNLMKSASLFMKHPVRALDFAANKSGLMASRKNSYERELAESYEKGSVKQFAGLQNATGKFKEWAMVHIGLTDRIVATILWSARYQEGLTRGYTDAEAVSLADELIRKTQSRGGVLYMPAIYRGSGLSRAFMMFSSDLNQAANLLFEVAGKWNIQPTQENLTQIALFFMLPTLVIYLVNNALRLDEPEDYIYEFMHQFAGAIPFLGPIMDATIKTLLDEAKSARGLIPDKSWTRYAADLSPAPLQTYETLTEGIAKKDPLKFAETAAQFTGIPFAAPKQYVQGAAKLLSGDVPNWRSLIWRKRKAMAKDLFGDMAKRLYSPRPKSNDSDVYSKWYKKLNPSEKERFRNYIDEVYLPLDLKREQNSIKKEVRQIQSDRKKVER